MPFVPVTPQVAVPELRIDGTSGRALLDDNRKAAYAIHKARDALMLTAPHGRDYQHNVAHYHKARAEHSARLSALTHILAELDLIAFAINNQLNEQSFLS